MNIDHLHPMIVHFPIALILVGFLTDIVYVFYKKCSCLPKMALYLEVLGALSAVVAVITGLFFTRPTSGYAGELKIVHASFAIMTTVVLVIAVILRISLQKKSFCNDSKIQTESEKKNSLLRNIVFFLMLVASVGILMTGMYGGKIVYDVWLMNI